MLRLTATGLAVRLRAGCEDEGRAETNAAAIGRVATAISQIDLNVNTQLCLEALANELVGRVAA